jgi:hypothetical protein
MPRNLHEFGFWLVHKYCASVNKNHCEICLDNAGTPASNDLYF